MRLVRGENEDEATSERRADTPIEADGATLSFSVPRDELGDPKTLTLTVAAAREWNEDEPAGVAPDIVPDRGTWTVELDG